MGIKADEISKELNNVWGDDAPTMRGVAIVRYYYWSRVLDLFKTHWKKAKKQELGAERRMSKNGRKKRTI